MSRPEPDATRRLRVVGALELLAPLFSGWERAVIDADLAPGERDGASSALPVVTPRVFGPSAAVVIADPDVFLDWALQLGAHGEQHPLAGARLDAGLARMYATDPPPGTRSYHRSAALMLDLSAAYAIAGRTQR